MRLSLTERRAGLYLIFFVAKATQVFTAICNSVTHFLSHPIANHSLSCAWLALIPSANQNKLKTVHLYCLIISWLALILYTIYVYITHVDSFKQKYQLKLLNLSFATVGLSPALLLQIWGQRHNYPGIQVITLGFASLISFTRTAKHLSKTKQSPDWCCKKHIKKWVSNNRL